VRAAVGAAFAAAVIVLLVVATGLGWLGGGDRSGLVPSKALAVHTSLDPRATFFGDPVVAEVTVSLDPRRVSVDRVRVQADFDPYVETRLPTIQRRRFGHAETISYRYHLQCVSDGCLPTATTKTVHLAPVTVSATAGGRAVRATAKWSPLSVASRVAAPALLGTPVFRHAATPPAAEFGLPRATPALLTAAGGVLALVACLLLGLELRAAASRRRAARRPPTPLEVAVVYARQAASRANPADRRRALGLLSVALRDHDRGLAETADDVAWAEQPPSPAQTIELADEVTS
jgi:hypothetical protein